MASSPEPSQIEDDDNNNNSNSSEKSPPPLSEPELDDDNNNNNSNNTEISPPPPPTTNATDDDVSPSPTPDQSPPPPPPTPSSPPPPPESPSPPPPVPPPPESDEPSPSPPPPDAASPPPPADVASPPPPADVASPPPPADVAFSPPPPAASPPPPSASPPPPAAANSTAPRGSPPPIKGSPPPPPAAFSPPPPGALSSQTPPPRQQSGNGSARGSSSGNPSPPPGQNYDGAIIAGVIVGGIAILALIIICLKCSKKQKKQRYYVDPGRTPAKGGDQFYNDPTQWQSPRPGDQIVNLPPPPGFMAVGTGAAWVAPSPPPMANTSSEFSSGYSGPHPTPMQPPSPSIGTNMSQFRYDDLLAATGGFSQANLLGQGGFGYVHKGVLPDKREVAVKSLKTGSGQGEREFQAEVEIISRVHHRHLVSLVGYCIANEQRLLVYEYVANKTLEFHLHGKGQPVMAWSTRLKIAVGSAKGLAYLHEDCHPRIIHRDIKAANILLDNNFEAMVADFGLAKLTSDNYTHVSTRVMGTFGYLAPEYASSGKLTEKSDVFSFGVMLLELITGRRPLDTTNKTMEDSLVDWARPLLSKALEHGNYNELVDPRLEGNYVTHELSCMVACAAASIRHSARRRPKMSQIAHALEGDSSLDDLNEGVKPGQSKAYNPTGARGEAYDTMAYNADMLKFKKMVMSSQEFNSSEYGTTSESEQGPSSSSGDNSREILKAAAGIKKTYT